MLKIHKEQMLAFQPLAETTFVRRVAAALRDKHADVAVRLPNSSATVAQLSDEVLEEMVQNGIARARQYDISYESALVAFVVTMFEAAPNFDAYPLLQQILQDEKTLPNSRIDLLLDRTSDQDWEEVKRTYDPGAWELTEKE